MQRDHIFYSMLNDLIKSLKKYKKNINIYFHNTVLSLKKWLKKVVLRDKGLSLVWDFYRHFFGIPNL